jgi:dihydrolipoamide dehydrogenase
VAHIAILGGGPAGYVGAIRARQLGGEVTLIEMDQLGGTCTNRGCIPSKALLKSAELAREAAQLDEHGIEVQIEGLDWAKTMQRKDGVVAQSRGGVEYLMRQRGVRVVRGRGRLVEPQAISVAAEAGEETVRADCVLIAVGSVPVRLPLPGFRSPGVVTSDEAVALERMPGSVAIVGAGSIGVEFADIFVSFGATVALIELLPRIVPQEDEEISAELARSFRRRGVDMFVNARVSEVVERDGKLVVRFQQEGREREVAAELVLCAVGRRPNTDGIGLEELGVAMNGRAIQVNGRMETNVPGLYAAGDAIGGMMLAHVAFGEGKVAVANALGRPAEMDYRAIPSVTYTHPEIGSVGLTEARAREQGIALKVGRFAFRAAGRAAAEGLREGLAKVVVEEGSGKVIGGHVIGLRATDLIHELCLAIIMGARAEQVAEMVHGHPTLSEPVMEAAADALGMAIHK